MENFKTCPNGHNYDAERYPGCPYCPGSTQNPDYEKTMKEFRKTKIMDEMNSQQFDKTIINEENLDMKTTTPGGNSSSHPFSRTTIVMKDGKDEKPLDQSVKRKLVGWLVTFTHDEYGQDYRLFIGKNRIGSGSNCDIVIKDSSVSAEHTTILFREDEFLIKDNFSTNGTKVNGVTTDEGKLKDGDELRCGNTVFKFKTAF
ncbi:MAG: FHA domain-containing protein [Bacteroidales bacterium]